MLLRISIQSCQAFIIVLIHPKDNVQTIIAEINNTPWGEQFCYLLDCSNSFENTGNTFF